MFGWEFPPKNTGGLGTACYGLTKGLANNGVSVTLVLPYDVSGGENDFVRIVSTGNLKVKGVKSILAPYLDYKEYNNINRKKGSGQIYGSNLFDEVDRYSEVASDIAKDEVFDVIHCHDWMTFMAGMKVKAFSGKPLVVHVHSTEFDRTGGNGVNQHVYDIERAGIHAADCVIAVSNYTKGIIVRHYGINPEKVHVVHNAVEQDGYSGDRWHEIKKDNKIVLFLGRVTLQKGPDYFIYAAKKALEFDSKIMFVIAGNGDMMGQIIEKAAELGIADKIVFTGFVSGKDVDRLYRMADLYVMPSVSEPFGITTLESIKNGTPVLISKQSGVSEVVNHCLKADFWDIDQIVNKMISALRYESLHDCLVENSVPEVARLRWDDSARRCMMVYNGGSK